MKKRERRRKGMKARETRNSESRVRRPGKRFFLILVSFWGFPFPFIIVACELRPIQKPNRSFHLAMRRCLAFWSPHKGREAFEGQNFLLLRLNTWTSRNLFFPTHFHSNVGPTFFFIGMCLSKFGSKSLVSGESLQIASRDLPFFPWNVIPKLT